MVTYAPTRFTRDDYMRLPEGFPAQLIDGALVKEPAPVPYHQFTLSRLQRLLVETIGWARVLFSPVDLTIDDENVFQPDLVVFSREQDIRPEDLEIETPLVVVEVLSPSTARYDRGVKVRGDLRKGVREVWLVDTDARTIEVRTGDATLTAEPGRPVTSIACWRMTWLN